MGQSQVTSMRWIYNPNRLSKIIKDLDVSVGPDRVVDLLRYSTEEKIYLSAKMGSLRKALSNGDVIVSSDGRKPKELKPRYFESKKPIPSISKVIPNIKNDDKTFVDAIEHEWGHNSMDYSENDNVKNTDELLRSEALENFDDPADRKW